MQLDAKLCNLMQSDANRCLKIKIIIIIIIKLKIKIIIIIKFKFKFKDATTGMEKFGEMNPDG